MRDAFIRGLKNTSIRARLLENSTLTLQQATEQARALEQAQIRADSYAQNSAAAISTNIDSNADKKEPSRKQYSIEGDNQTMFDSYAAAAGASFKKGACYNCGGPRTFRVKKKDQNQKNCFKILMQRITFFVGLNEVH